MDSSLKKIKFVFSINFYIFIHIVVHMIRQFYSIDKIYFKVLNYNINFGNSSLNFFF